MKPLLCDAINPFTGLPFAFDDPNLRWGDPSTYLEPGDPGFVPYGTPSATARPHTRMKHQSYYPTKTSEQLIWLQNFQDKLAGHAPGLGITVAKCAAAIADARWLIYVLGSWLPAVNAWKESCTKAALEAQIGNAPIFALPVFVPPPLPGASGTLPAVVARPSGALTRIFDLLGDIRASDTYSDPIGTDLGLIGPEESAPDMAALQPLLAAHVSGSHVELDWKWQGYRKFLDQLELQVDRGTGWAILAFDTTPGYTDNTPFPATATQWKYRAIYRVNDMQVGLWSATVSVMVGA